MGLQSNQLKQMALGLSLMTLGIAGCDKSGGYSYSLLSANQSFGQSASTVNNKVDILWVVDNSSSMTPLQTNLVNNFNSFISNFQTKGYDFRMAVTTTDAYLANAAFNNDPTQSSFRDGVGSTHTGVFVIDSTTPNLTQTFVTNASQGQAGSGDERAFSSFQEALNNPANANFVRSDSFFSIIILSDEDDFSDITRPQGSWLVSGGIPDHDYQNPNMPSVDSYLSYLDTFTNSASATNRRYNVSAIAVLDSTCLNQHIPDAPSTVVGQRYVQMANETNGVVGSICDANYSTTLQNIQQKILELSTQFPLNRTPVISSIVVIVNGQTIPQDPTNGWTYISTANAIQFHGTAIPPQGASISVSFDPATVKN